jgi:putative flippase GtrA
MVRGMITLVVNDPWWTYGLDFLIGVLSGAAGMYVFDRWATWKGKRDG